MEEEPPGAAEELLELSEKTQQEIRGWNQKTAGDVFIGGGETEAMRLVARDRGVSRRDIYQGLLEGKE